MATCSPPVHSAGRLYHEGRIGIVHLLLTLFLLAARGKIFKRNRIGGPTAADVVRALLTALRCHTLKIPSGCV